MAPHSGIDTSHIKAAAQKDFFELLLGVSVSLVFKRCYCSDNAPGPWEESSGPRQVTQRPSGFFLKVLRSPSTPLHLVFAPRGICGVM